MEQQELHVEKVLSFQSENDHRRLLHYGSIGEDSGFESQERRSSLTVLQKFGYGLGHFYNDLCAFVWYCYTLYFMQNVLLMPPSWASGLMLLGQVGDAVSTALVGILVDHYGTKRKWHMIGTGLTLASFPLLFSLCPWCSTTISWWEPVYFGTIILIFQFSWALVQVTHLSMIPELSQTKQDQSDLITIRYSLSVIASIMVYLVTWYVFQKPDQTRIKPGSVRAYHFRDISLMLTFMGIISTTVFQMSLSSTRISYHYLSSTDDNRNRNRHGSDIDECEKNNFAWYKIFLKYPPLYQSALLYTLSRCFMIIGLVYLPIWLHQYANQTAQRAHTLEEQFRMIPLTSFIVSIAVAFILNRANKILNDKIWYLCGSIVGLVSCIWLALGVRTSTPIYVLFLTVSALGASSSMTLISSLCIATNLIENSSSQGGFLYSIITFSDKLTTGIVLLIIEALKCNEQTQCPSFYRDVLAYTCGTSAVFGIIIIFLLMIYKHRYSLGINYNRTSSCYVIS